MVKILEQKTAQGIELLSEIKDKPITFDEETGKLLKRVTFTIYRRIYDDTIIVVTHVHDGSSSKGNGPYYFDHLDERDCPVFIQDIEEIISDMHSMANGELEKEYESKSALQFDTCTINTTKDAKKKKQIY